MADSARTPIVLITGSLGSGKTTLLRHILDSVPFRIAVLVNEFGELAVDSRVIQGKDIDIIELTGGCVCCSMTGEFEAAVKEIIGTIAPEFIVVEATGVAESDALVFEVEDNLPEVRLDSVICIVDAYLGVKFPYIGYTLRTQISSADIILINKVDLVTAAETETVEAQAKNHNSDALFLRTVNCELNPGLLFGHPSGPRAGAPAFFSGDKYNSFVWTTDKIIDKLKFDELIGTLPNDLIRAKGFVRFKEGGFLFNYVVGRVDFEQSSVDGTELVFIGLDADRFRTDMVNRLRECEQSEINAL